MVWLCVYSSAISVGRRGYFIRSNDFYLPSLRLEGWGSVPCGVQLLEEGLEDTEGMKEEHRVFYFRLLWFQRHRYTSPSAITVSSYS
jgi:hypothetical protein